MIGLHTYGYVRLVLMLWVFLNLFSNTLSSQVYFSEDFSSGQMPPENWSIDEIASQWTVAASSNAGGTSPEASFQWIQEIATTRLISPPTDLSGLSTVSFQLNYMYDDYLGEGPAIGVATRSGTGNWNTVWEILPENNVGPEKLILNINNVDVGQVDFQVCFYISGNLFNLDYCYVDDLTLFNPFELTLNILLEGPILSNTMSNTLNVAGYLPLSQPYTGFPWYYSGPENVSSIPASNICDWVLVELWYKNANNQPSYVLEERRAGFVLQSGRITDLDGLSPLEFTVPDADSLYVWVHHRNHLSVMSAMAIGQFGDIESYDFTVHPGMAIQGIYAMKALNSGSWCILSGDGNADGNIDNKDKYEVWVEQNGNTGYYSADYNLDGIVNEADLDKFWEPNSGSGHWVPDTAEIPFNCGDTLFDQRDGHFYSTVLIGNQCWMEENLNFETSNSWCYNNNPDNCETYGRIYSWYDLMNGEPASNEVPSGVQGICPEGWHVPSDPEWCLLTTHVDNTINCDTSGYNGTDGGTKMKSTSGWSTQGNGTNESGFNALPAGCMGIYHFDDLFLFSYFWSASDDYPGFALLIKLNYGLPTIGRYFSLKDRGYSLRCLKD